jgi:hypothetical protein
MASMLGVRVQPVFPSAWWIGIAPFEACDASSAKANEIVLSPLLLLA